MTYKEAIEYLGKGPADASTFSSVILLTYLIEKGVVNEAEYRAIFTAAVERRKAQADDVEIIRKFMGVS